MSYQQLTNDERYQIKACLQLHMNQISIAKLLNRSPATISREIRRNTGVILPFLTPAKNRISVV